MFGFESIEKSPGEMDYVSSRHVTLPADKLEPKKNKNSSNTFKLPEEEKELTKMESNQQEISSQQSRRQFKRIAWLRKEFDLEDSEELLESCSAALVRRILIHGRLFVTSKNLIFHSKILGSVTKKKWPFVIVKDVQKRRGKFVANSIKISFESSNITPAILASLGNRERILDVIASRLNEKAAGSIRRNTISFLDGDIMAEVGGKDISGNILVNDFDANITEDDFKSTSSEEAVSALNNESSVIQSSGLIPPSSGHSSVRSKRSRRNPSMRLSMQSSFSAADFTIDEVLDSLIWKKKGDSVDKVFGREFETKTEQARDVFKVPPIFAFNSLFLNDWILTYLTETKNNEPRVTEWYKNEAYGVMQRDISYVRPLTHRMGPKQTRVREKQTYCFTSDGGVLVESEARNLDVPFGENFWVESYFQLKPTSGGKKTEFIASIAIHFAKRTMLRGAIESATISETKQSFEKMIELAAGHIEESVPASHVALFLRRLRRPSFFDQLWDISKKISIRSNN